MITIDDTLSKSLRDSSAGLPGFVERTGLAGEDRDKAVNDVLTRVHAEGLETIRIGFVDPHGLVRSKTVMPDTFETALRNGMDFSPGPFLFDTGLDLVGNPFSPGAGVGLAEMEGAADFVALPDPATFATLPWSPATGWVLATEFLKSGRPVPFSGRQILRRLTEELARRGMTYVIGLEVEWYLTRLKGKSLEFGDVGGFGQPGTSPEVAPINLGYQFNSDNLGDAIEDLLTPLRRELLALGLPLRTMEHESGPGQMESTFAPLPALQAADAMILFRTAVKQSCARRGLHATFMCKPALQGVDPSGWHLHQSLYSRDGRTNLFMSSDTREPVSETARHFAGGLIAHAPGVCLFSTPTINGYRRYEAGHGLAPSRAGWSSDSRGAMLRILGGPHDRSTHFENRSGEPAANPYFYIASQLVAGMAGVRTKIEPGEPDQAGSEPAGPPLPTTLAEAVDAALGDDELKAALGAGLVEYLGVLKRNEVRRFESSGDLRRSLANGVSEWEQREYFSVF